MSVHVIFAINACSVQASADMMEEKAEVKWGNWIGYVLLPFNIGLRDDPLDYIRHAKSTIDRKKHSFEALFTFFIAQIALKLFGAKVRYLATNKCIHHIVVMNLLIN